MIREHFGDGRRLVHHLSARGPTSRNGGCPEPVARATPEPVIVMNGDLLTKVDFVRLLDFHGRQGFVATMAMREHQQVPYGVLKLGDGYVVQELSRSRSSATTSTPASTSSTRRRCTWSREVLTCRRCSTH